MSDSPASTPHNIHAIGIGRTGAAYVEALIRTGEIEDLLATPGTSFAALLIDIGDDDIQVPGDYARSMNTRLKLRGIPIERFHYDGLALPVPDAAALGKLPKGAALPKAGEHIPRAIAKTAFTLATTTGERPLAVALQRFADQVKKAEQPSTVFVAYGLAGGTGSGMAIDVATALAALLPASAQVVGIGQLAHSGDGDYFNSAAQYQAIDAVDAALASAAKPFGGGFFVVASEQSWQRLSAYTSTGLKEVRQRFKQMVTNRFVADSFMRFAMSDGSAHLLRALKKAPGKCTLFDVAKLTHPGVQVLPGEAGSKWDAVMQQWIGFVPKYSGLAESFKTDYAEVHVHASRDMQVEMIEDGLKDVIGSHYLKKGSAATVAYRNEFFDVLTAYGNVILPGAAKGDLAAYPASKASFDKLDAGAKLLEQV
jgi:Tubulin like